MRVSEDLVRLLKELEGCRLDAYQDKAGVWTIGYGHTASVAPGDRITLDRAEELFRSDLASFERAVSTLVRRPMSQSHFDALVCLAFNIGVGPKGFAGSTLLRLFNAGDVRGAAEQFGRWIHVRGEPVELGQGAKGELVIDWQRALADAGFTLAIDGHFGPKTAEATRAWQRREGLTPDGLGRVRPKLVDPVLVRRRFVEVVRFLT